MSNYIVVTHLFITLLAASAEAEKHLILVSLPVDKYYTKYINHIAKFARDLSAKAAEDDYVVLVYPKQWKSISAHPNINLSNTRCIYTDEEIDLWMRDFGFVNPNRPFKFKYEPRAYLSVSDAKFVDESFRKLLTEQKVTEYSSDDRLIVDGGNVVDNHFGKAVVSERFFENNNLSWKGTRADLIRSLEKALNATVAFIPDPKDTTGHADGVVSFIEPDTMLIADYADNSFSDVITVINRTFPNVKTVRMPCPESNISDWKGRSAVGVYVNILFTDSSVYVPTFNKPSSDEEAIRIVKGSIKQRRQVKSIDTTILSRLGGSVRCMTMQVKWTNPIAQKLYKASVLCSNASSLLGSRLVKGILHVLVAVLSSYINIKFHFG